MGNATAKAVAAMAIFSLAQLTLLLCSISHPSIDDWVTISFVISIVFYPMVFAYHGKRIKDWKDGSP